jgi:hypothetical protein
LNVEANKQATIGLSMPTVKDFNLNTDNAVLYINKKKVASHRIRHMRENYNATQLHEYYKVTYKWSDKVFSRIWWEVHGVAIESFDVDTRTSVQKFIHNQSACNHRENRHHEFKSEFMSHVRNRDKRPLSYTKMSKVSQKGEY